MTVSLGNKGLFSFPIVIGPVEFGVNKLTWSSSAENKAKISRENNF